MNTKTVLQTSIKTLQQGEHIYDFTVDLESGVQAFKPGPKSLNREAYRLQLHEHAMLFEDTDVESLKHTLGRFKKFAQYRTKSTMTGTVLIAELIFHVDSDLNKLLKLQARIARGGLEYRVSALRDEVRAANKDKAKSLGELTLLKSNQFDFNRQPWWVRLIKFVASGCRINVVSSSKGE